MNAKLKTVLAGIFGLKEDGITPQTSKEDVANWDSLKQMDLVMTVEQEFDIALDIEDIVSMTSVGKIIEVLKSKGLDFAD